MNDLTITEGGPPVQCDLPLMVVERLTSMGVLTATPTGPDCWDVRAARKVGVVRMGSITVRIVPKVQVGRLLWLLGWAHRPLFESPGPVDLHEIDELVPALAEAFCGQAERALAAGLLQGYREIETDETVLRGRLRTDDQLRRRFGLPIPLLVRYDDFQTDIAENQILKAAVSRLLMLTGVQETVRRRLRALRGLLVDVSELTRLRDVPNWQATRLNARYHEALWLAEIVLLRGSINQEPGRIRVDGFLVDLYQVFEDFLAATLGAALERLGGRCQSQEPFTLDEEGDIDIRPDLVWRVGGSVRAVIDAKYKAEKPAGFPQADMYQALAYATAHGLSEAHLVYAKGNEHAQSWTVRNTVVTISAHTLDLERSPNEILKQISELADRIAGLTS